MLITSELSRPPRFRRQNNENDCCDISDLKRECTNERFGLNRIIPYLRPIVFLSLSWAPYFSIQNCVSKVVFTLLHFTQFASSFYNILNNISLPKSQQLTALNGSVWTRHWSRYFLFLNIGFYSIVPVWKALLQWAVQ